MASDKIPAALTRAIANTKASASMRIFWSASRNGFFNDRWHKDTMPADALEITQEAWKALRAEQSAGKQLTSDPSGMPIAIERVLSTEERAGYKRAERDRALAATDGLVVRHRDEREEPRATTLSAEQYKALQAYRQALRDLPKLESFPDVELPAAPSGVKRA